MKVLVIGGTGVISTSIIDKLVQENHIATAFNRGLRPVRYINDIEVISGDKNAPDFKSKVNAQKFDVVIDMISMNKEDAAITINAFNEQDIHFIFTSTISVYKRPYKGVPIKETHDLYDTNIFPYAYNKARMEDYLREKMADGLKITIIRPSLTYAVGCKNIGPLRSNYGIIRRIEQDKPLIMFGDGTSPWSITFAPDLAKAYVGALNREVCFGQTYHASSDDIFIWDDLLLGFGKIIDKKPEILHISSEMLSKAAPSMFDHVLYEKMYSGVFDTSKIKRDIPEFIIEYTLDKILNEIYNWYITDADARIVNEELDAFEDTLVAKYYECMKIWE